MTRHSSIAAHVREDDLLNAALAKILRPPSLSTGFQPRLSAALAKVFADEARQVAGARESLAKTSTRASETQYPTSGNRLDDELPLGVRTAKGPTAENLKSLAVQAAWLREHIKWEKLRCYAYSCVRDITLVDEIVQELYRDLLQWSPEKLQSLNKPDVYAKQALKHRLFNWISRYAKPVTTTSLPDDDENIVDESPSQEDVLDNRQRVINLLAKLPEKWARPFVLTKIYGYTVAETAKELGLTAGAVKKRVLRSVQLLRGHPSGLAYESSKEDHPTQGASQSQRTRATRYGDEVDRNAGESIDPEVRQAIIECTRAWPQESVAELSERVRRLLGKSGDVLYDLASTIDLPTEEVVACIEPRLAIAGTTIAARLRSDPEVSHRLSPRQFELLVAEMLADNGWDVQLTPSTHDGGKDILVYLDSGLGKLLCVVEAKRYASQRKVGFDIVRRLYGTLESIQASHAMLVRTSAFTAPAKDLQLKSHYHLRLREYVGIVRWVSSMEKAEGRHKQH